MTRAAARSGAAPGAQGPGKPERAVLETAAEWFAILAADTVRDDERQRWQAWHDASRDHARAWQMVTAISAQFSAANTVGAKDALTLAGRRRRASIKTWLLLFGTALSGAGVMTAPASRRYLASMSADLRTAVGEIRQVALSDGTRLWLNTDSAVNLRYTDSLRAVELLAGEILIETAKDPAPVPRPFEVIVPPGRLRALGTRFAVRLLDDRTRLDVFEGAVEARLDGSHEARTVSEGDSLAFDASGFDGMADADDSRIGWFRKELIAVNMPLRDFLEELGRYLPGHLGCTDEVAHLKLVGVYPLGDPARVLDALARTLPVRVHRRLPWWTTVEAAT